MEEKILTVKQTAKMLQIDPNTIYRWSREGKFPASKVGGDWRILKSDVIKFLEKNRHKNVFLSDRQIAELVTALVGRKELPLKFQYIGEGADRFVKFEHTAEYGIGQSEMGIFTENDRRIMTHLENNEYNLLDMGCGDGKKAAAIMNRFKTRDSLQNYFPIDISARMIDIGTSNFTLAHPNSIIETFVEDFEAGNIARVTYYLRRRYQRNHFILFLGTTIGNLSDSHRLLVNLRESMTNDDFLLIGLAMYNKRKNPLEGYDKKIIYDWLWTIPNKVGIKQEDASIELSFNKKKLRIESTLFFNRGWAKTIGGHEVKIEKGERILIAVSQKFTNDEVLKLLGSAGFKILEIFINKEKDYGIILCKPHRWEVNQ